MSRFGGILQADAYGGYNRLYASDRDAGAVTPAFCWAHARRGFFELADIARNTRRGRNATVISPIALEAVKRIDALFAIERSLNGLPAAARLDGCRQESAPLAADLEAWLRDQRSRRPAPRPSPNRSTICCAIGRPSPASSTMGGFV